MKYIYLFYIILLASPALGVEYIYQKVDDNIGAIFGKDNIGNLKPVNQEVSRDLEKLKSIRNDLSNLLHNNYLYSSDSDELEGEYREGQFGYQYKYVKNGYTLECNVSFKKTVVNIKSPILRELRGKLKNQEYEVITGFLNINSQILRKVQCRIKYFVKSTVYRMEYSYTDLLSDKIINNNPIVWVTPEQITIIADMESGLFGNFIVPTTLQTSLEIRLFGTSRPGGMLNWDKLIIMPPENNQIETRIPSRNIKKAAANFYNWLTFCLVEDFIIANAQDNIEGYKTKNNKDFIYVEYEVNGVAVCALEQMDRFQVEVDYNKETFNPINYDQTILDISSMFLFGQVMRAKENNCTIILNSYSKKTEYFFYNQSSSNAPEQFHIIVEPTKFILTVFKAHVPQGLVSDYFKGNEVCFSFFHIYRRLVYWSLLVLIFITGSGFVLYLRRKTNQN